MKINSFKILYSTTIPIQSYGVNDKVAVEIEVVPDESKSPNEQFDLEAIISDHKKNVDAIVAKLYPGRSIQVDQDVLREHGITQMNIPGYRYDETKYPIQQSSTSYEERRVGDIANDIRSCKDLRVLETYRFIAPTKPEFQEAYEEMHKKLSSKSET